MTNTRDATADYFLSGRAKTSLSFRRLDTDMLASECQFSYSTDRCSLHLDGDTLNPADITAVWLRRPEPVVVGEVHDEGVRRHAANEWAEALEAFLMEIPIARWVNHPSANLRASHKLDQLRRARSFGLFVPDTVVTQSPGALRDFVKRCGGAIIAKPLASGHLDRPGRHEVIYTNRVETEHLKRAEDLRICPTLFQEEIKKVLDIRITIVDRELIAVGIRVSDEEGRQRVDVRRNNMADALYGEIDVPMPVRDALIALVGSFGLRFAAVDMGVDRDGRWVFFEVNPNGQWAWLDQTGCVSIAALLERAFVNEQ